MRKGLVSSLAALSLAVMIMGSASPAAAADYNNVGVTVNNLVTYQSSFTGSSDNKTTVLVWGVVGTVVYLNITYYLPNGAVDYKYQTIIDVYIGGLDSVYIIAGNLGASDGISSGSKESGIWINDTITITVAGISRAVNHMRFADGSWEVWWDKETGLMVKSNVFFYGWYNHTMISTTAFSAPPSLFSNPMTLVALGELAVIAILLGYVVMIRRGRKRGR